MSMSSENLSVLAIPTDETLKFVLKYLNAQDNRILEVGCGNGELAVTLQNLGFQVVAIDPSAEAVENTRRLGVEARVAEFPNFEEAGFDAILFTRSLHHIRELEAAVEKTHRLLHPNGLVILEDFAFDEANEATIEWLYGVTSLLDVCGQLNPEEDNFAKDLLLGQGSYQVWQENHHHDLHSAPKMMTELKKYFAPLEESKAPYLYRYLCLLLNKNPNGLTIASQILTLEKRMADLGRIDLIGLRFAGRKLSWTSGRFDPLDSID